VSDNERKINHIGWRGEHHSVYLKGGTSDILY
jgi:hypothetical protein